MFNCLNLNTCHIQLVYKQYQKNLAMIDIKMKK